MEDVCLQRNDEKLTRTLIGEFDDHVTTMNMYVINTDLNEVCRYSGIAIASSCP